MLTEKEVLAALSTVLDPDIKKDLVSLNMIQQIVTDKESVRFTLVLTTPACPLKEKIKNDCIQALHTQAGKSFPIHIETTAQITSARNSNINVLPSVKNIICVASGKGGVGKSTISVNLALALAAQGAKVGIIDADIYGPSIPTMLGIKGVKPTVRLIKDKHYLEPVEAHGIKVLSMGMLVDDNQAIVWRGPMVTSALRQFVTDCIWGKLDYLILDAPPGTGDIHLTMIQTMNVTGAIIVSTPQEVALADARKALAMFRLDTINVPVLGIVENMAYFSPADAPDKQYYIFGKEGAKKLAESYEIPLLAQLPIQETICQNEDSGTSHLLHEQQNATIQAAFDQLAQRVAQEIAIRNAQEAAVV